MTARSSPFLIKVPDQGQVSGAADAFGEQPRVKSAGHRRDAPDRDKVHARWPSARMRRPGRRQPPGAGPRFRMPVLAAIIAAGQKGDFAKGVNARIAVRRGQSR